MPAESPRLLELAQAVADGQAIDWAEAESSAGSSEEAAILRELRLLASVAEVHRSSSDASSTQPTASGPSPLPRVVAGTAWGSLLIREWVGGGGFGNVYRAWDPRLVREVALKLISDPATGDYPSAVVEEGRLLARVRHPHVVSVYGADSVGGQIGIWMEFIRGRTLEQVLRQDGPFGAHEAALVGVALCGALAAVHAQGLVHRDVKAQNVMREEGGRLVLMDFGAGSDAALTRERQVGTPVYMAPELFTGQPATPRSDIYSLGVLLFRLVTGEFPVKGRTFDEVGSAHQRAERQRPRDLRPDLPAPFVYALERATAGDPLARFESAGAMEEALAKALLADSDRKPRWRFGPRGARPLWLALAGLAAAAVASSFVWKTVLPHRPAAGRLAMKSLAVRPLATLDGGAAQAYFAAGLTDVLLAQFGSVRALRVVPVSARDAASAEKDPLEIARRLGVDGVLEASVQRSEGRVRVSARVLDAASGAIAWGRTYEGSESQAFNLQGQIAADVAREIGISVTSSEERQLSRTYTLKPEAQDAYLRGRYLLDGGGRSNLEKARLEFERAVRLEPLYAPAHSGLAVTYLALAAAGVLTPTEVRALAPSAANTAASLDPTLAEAAVAVADVRFRLDWDFEGAEKAYRRAVALNPSYVYARGQLARFLAAAGKPEEGLREAQEAYRIDPLSDDIHGVVGTMLFYTRRYEEAIAHFQSRSSTRSLRTLMGLGRAYAAVGRFPEAIEKLTAAVAQSGDDPSFEAELARTYAQAGQADRARRMLEGLEARRRSAPGYVAPQDLAYIHVALKERDQALALLDEAVNEQASRLLWLAVDPRVDALRDDPRFRSLISRLHNVR